jgi:hypothetical protein
MPDRGPETVPKPRTKRLDRARYRTYRFGKSWLALILTVTVPALVGLSIALPGGNPSLGLLTFVCGFVVFARLTRRHYAHRLERARGDLLANQWARERRR